MAEIQANIDNEMVLIANLMYHPENRNTILTLVQDDDYLYEIHKSISKTIRHLTSRDVAVEKDSIIASAKNLGYEIEFEYILDLQKAFTEKSANLDEHIRILKLDKLKYSLRDSDIKNLIKTISNSGYNISEVRDSIYQTYLKILNFETSSEEEVLQSMETVVERYKLEYELRRKNEGFHTTGFHHLDKHMSEAFAPKKITIVGARPGCGKSSFVYECARRLSNRGENVYIFSLEMEAIDIMDKYLACATGIPIDKLVKGADQLSNDEVSRLNYELERYRTNTNLYISDRSGLSLADIRTQIQKLLLERKHKDVKVIIDLFGQITDFTDTGLAQQYEIKLDRVKQMVKELAIHAILVNQINRSAERADTSRQQPPQDDTSSNNPVYRNRPLMSQLKNSGKLEEVADNIFLLFRAKYYDESLEDDILEVMIKKQRKGAMNVDVYFEFIPHIGRIIPTVKLPYDKRFSTLPTPPQTQGVKVD